MRRTLVGVIAGAAVLALGGPPAPAAAFSSRCEAVFAAFQGDARQYDQTSIILVRWGQPFSTSGGDGVTRSELRLMRNRTGRALAKARAPQMRSALVRFRSALTRQDVAAAIAASNDVSTLRWDDAC